MFECRWLSTQSEFWTAIVTNGMGHADLVIENGGIQFNIRSVKFMTLIYLFKFSCSFVILPCIPGIRFKHSFVSCCGYIAKLERDMHPNHESLPRIKRSQMDERFTANGDFHDELSTLFWQSRAQLTLRNQLMKERNTNIAKNVILFLGDGMSIPTLTAARIYLGQNRNSSGEESRLSFESFPYIGLSKVNVQTILIVGCYLLKHTN